MDESDSVGSELEKKIAGIVVDFANIHHLHYRLESGNGFGLGKGLSISLGRNSYGEMQTYFRHYVLFGNEGTSIVKDATMDFNRSIPNPEVIRGLYREFISYMEREKVVLSGQELINSWERRSPLMDASQPLPINSP